MVNKQIFLFFIQANHSVLLLQICQCQRFKSQIQGGKCGCSPPMATLNQLSEAEEAGGCDGLFKFKCVSSPSTQRGLRHFHSKGKKTLTPSVLFSAVCPPEANSSATSAVESILSGTLQSVHLSELMFRNFPLFTPHSHVRQRRKGSN